MAEIKDPRGKLLLGEAVRLLVQSGASGAAITDFINEYSEVLHATLAPPPAAAEPDLKAQVKDALKEALAELAPPSRRTEAGSRLRIAVFIDGARTSVSLNRDLLASTVAAVGDEKKVRQLIQEFANTKPADWANRTAWVEQQLQHHSVMTKAESTLMKH
jgi:predicted DNA-binding ribbon-helix-helix protein